MSFRSRRGSVRDADPVFDVHRSRFPAQANSSNLARSSGDAGFRAVRHSRGDACEQLFLKSAIPLVGDGFHRTLPLKIVIERPTGCAHGLGQKRAQALGLLRIINEGLVHSVEKDSAACILHGRVPPEIARATIPKLARELGRKGLSRNIKAAHSAVPVPESRSGPIPADLGRN